MGRKIPGRKHHGVNDPEKQAQKRFNKIKDKVNAPPTNPDDQPIPKSLSRIIELKNRVKNGEFDRKKGDKKKRAKTGKIKLNPRYQQFKNESDGHYMYRINKMVETVKKETNFEIKYGVEIKRDEQGEVESVVKRPKDELVTLLKKARKEKEKGGKGKRKKKKKEEDKPKLTKAEKRKLKLAEKKQKKNNKGLDFDNFKDQVQFGEQIHAPPTLSLPRNVKKDETSRPGKKELLLKSFLNDGKENNKSNLDPKSKVIDRKGKRKELPNALRRQLDRQQQEVIQAYKDLKAQKYNNNSS